MRGEVKATFRAVNHAQRSSRLKQNLLFYLPQSFSRLGPIVSFWGTNDFFTL